jgi:hypothetical protein
MGLKSVGFLLLLLLSAGSPALGQGSEKLFVLRVEGAAGEVRTLRAIKGDRVRIEVFANRPVVLHIHGLGLEIVAGPDRRGEANLTTNATGRFPIQVHDTADPKAARGHSHRAPFAYLEVHPK